MIVVTGALGFIGSNFCQRWARENSEEVVGVDSYTYAAHPENYSSTKTPRMIAADICDQRTATLIKELQPRVIIHFAAETHVDNSITGSAVFMKTNVMGTHSLLEAVREHTPNTLFFHISTDEVYGSLGKDDGPFTEKSRYEPNSPYSASKAASDHLVRAYSKTYRLKTITVNCSNNYGKYQDKEKFIPKCIHNAMNNLPIPVYGSGMQIRDWIHVDDFCSAIMFLISKGQHGETYNVGANNEHANIDIAKYIQGNKNLIEHVTDRAGHDFRYAIDSSKLLSLGWKPAKTNFMDNLDELIEWNNHSCCPLTTAML